MKKLIFIFLPIAVLSQPPNWPPPGSGQPPGGTPPGQNIDCWPPPCVPIGTYIPFALIVTAIIIAGKKLKKE